MMMHARFGNMEAETTNNSCSSEGSTSENVDGLDLIETSRGNVLRPETSILKRVRRRFGKVWLREFREDQAADQSPDFGWRVDDCRSTSESGWLNYFTQRTTRASRTSIGDITTCNKQAKRHRKIVGTHFGGKPVAELKAKEVKRSSVRFLGIRRSISMPSDEMEKVHLNLKRSMSSKAVMRPIRQGSNEDSNRFYTHEERVVEQTKDFCRDIIIQTLKRNNLFNRVKINRPVSVDQWVTHEVQKICTELERRNPALCRHISKQIGITLRSEEVLRKVFFEFGLEIVSTDAPRNDKPRGSLSNRRSSRQEEASTPLKKLEITWGRIMAVFVIAGAFAIDCIKQGHSELVAELIEICGEFFQSEGVVDWIISQGGWEKLCDINSTKVKEPDPTNTWNIFLISACVVTSIAIGIGISNLSLEAEEGL